MTVTCSLAEIIGALSIIQMHHPTLSLRGPMRTSRREIAREDITLRRMPLRCLPRQLPSYPFLNQRGAFLFVAVSQRSSRRSIRSECYTTVLRMERMPIPAPVRGKKLSASLRRGIAIEATCDGLFNI